MGQLSHTKLIEKPCANDGPKSLVSILFLYLTTSALTFFAAILSGSPYSLWFRDTHYLLLGVLVILVLLGVIWDGAMISLGLAYETLGRRIFPAKSDLITLDSTRKKRFFTCGPHPLLMVVLTAFAVLGTSNITLISLKFVGNITFWRDSYLWSVESALIEWITSLSINVSFWDTLYHSAWLIELFATFVLILIGRGSRIIRGFCISLILLFYIGRFLGLLNPVMGPAFFQPDLFRYLDGSLTGKAMQLLSTIIDQSPGNAVDEGGILLGGVSAMPSLHVGMVFVTSYWLFIAKRWTLLITTPWVLLVWASTVILGWHYALDGAGGILLGAGCLWLTNRFFGHSPPSP